MLHWLLNIFQLKNWNSNKIILLNVFELLFVVGVVVVLALVNRIEENAHTAIIKLGGNK